jgi:hypothetical protein
MLPPLFFFFPERVIAEVYQSASAETAGETLIVRCGFETRVTPEEGKLERRNGVVS